MSAISKPPRPEPPRPVARNRPIDSTPGEEKQPESLKKRKIWRFNKMRPLKSMSLEELARQQTFKKDIDFTPELYNEILEKWLENEKSIFKSRQIQIKDDISITDSINIKNMHEFSNTGLRSNVYVITINDDRQFIIKQNLQGNSIRAEAELQRYAATVHGLAPDVFAYNNTTILMEKCEIIPEFRTKFINSLHIGIHRTESNTDYRLIQELMQKERLKNLDASIDLYDKTGMFIMDTHDNNYVLKKNKIVPIDFDDVRFKNQGIYQRWRADYQETFGTEPLNQTLRVLKNCPEDPPYYYWWRNRADVYKGLDKLESIEEFTWNRQTWFSKRKEYEITLQVIIEDVAAEEKHQKGRRRKNITRRVSTTNGALTTGDEETKEKYIPVFRFFILRI